MSNLLAYKISKECIASYACNKSSNVCAFLQDASVFRLMSMVFVLPPQMTGFTAFPLAATEISERSHSEAALSDEKRIPNIILKRFPLSKPLGLGSAC